MANNLLQQAQQLKLLIEQARHQFENTHDSVFEMLRSQFEKEKNEASCLHLSFILSTLSLTENFDIHLAVIICTTWLRVIADDVKPMNFGIHTAWRKATDRIEWRRVVGTATLQPE